MRLSQALKRRRSGRPRLGHVFNRLGSPAATTTQKTVAQEPPFRAGASRGARHGSYPEGRKKYGKSSTSSSTRQHWWVPGGGSPGRLCLVLAESAGQLPGHRHRRGRGEHNIPATTSAHPSVHQLPDQKQPARPPASRGCLAVEGSSTTRSQTSLLVWTSGESGCSSTLDSSQWRPYWGCISKSRPFTNIGWPTQTSQPAICTDYWACWCL